MNAEVARARTQEHHASTLSVEPVLHDPDHLTKGRAQPRSLPQVLAESQTQGLMIIRKLANLACSETSLQALRKRNACQARCAHFQNVAL